MKVLVTGGAGYIGSHTVSALIQDGYEVVVLDNLSTGFRVAVNQNAEFIAGDIQDQNGLVKIFREKKIQAVIHFAGKLNVNESMEKPLDYYQHNTMGIVSLLGAMAEASVDYIVFSSTAALFGDAIQDRTITEDDAKHPLNPYGFSKLMCEQILEDVSNVSDIRFCCLRYFNVAGASDDLNNGQRTTNAFHLIQLGVQAATNKRNGLKVFGTDYPTPDGTCIRDYIHVQDLAQIHILALNKIIQTKTSVKYNCGYGVGYSVFEVISMIKKVSGVNFEVLHSGRRAGDASSLIADSSKLKIDLEWKPLRANLELICRSAFEWEKKQMLSKVSFLT